jgi:hypothetical protein
MKPSEVLIALALVLPALLILSSLVKLIVEGWPLLLSALSTRNPDGWMVVATLASFALIVLALALRHFGA